MASKVVDMTCPGCGARVSVGQKECDFCHKPVVISTFNTLEELGLPTVNKYVKSYGEVLEDNPEASDVTASLALCYFKLGRYDKAIESLEKAQEFDMENTELLFYEAIALLHGKKAFLNQRSTIDQILELMEAATMIEPRGVYYYFIAYIKYDYFFRKHLNVPPDYSEVLATAHEYGVSDYDINQLFEMLKVARPDAI